MGNNKTPEGPMLLGENMPRRKFLEERKTQVKQLIMMAAELLT